MVETKRECIEGVTEMLWLNSALERSTPPPFEQRGDVMHAGYDFVGVFAAGADDGRAIYVTRRW